jgi:hypothetical protein
MMRHRFNSREPWRDPKLGYRNNGEYKRQRQEALDQGGVAAANLVEERWAKRWLERLKFTRT